MPRLDTSCPLPLLTMSKWALLDEGGLPLFRSFPAVQVGERFPGSAGGGAVQLGERGTQLRLWPLGVDTTNLLV
jgi:hypothetical protein